MRVAFGDGSGDWVHLGDGWQEAMPGSRTSVGPRSEIWLEYPAGAGDRVIELDLESAAGAKQPQRVLVVLRGETIGRAVVGPRRRVALVVPARLLSVKGPVRLELSHEPANDSIEPEKADPRAPALIVRSLALTGRASFAGPLEPDSGVTRALIEDATGLTAAQFMSRFESLGENCEFGFVQRLCGAEPLGLLRWGAPKLPQLIACLRDRFTRFGALEDLELRPVDGEPPELWVHEKRSGMVYHTFKYRGAVDEAALLAQQASRLRLLARKFLEDLAEGRKILVWKATGYRATAAAVMELQDALAEIGPCPLLWVEAADLRHPPGSVTPIRPGLLLGHVYGFSRLANVPSLNIDPWLTVCLKAHQSCEPSAPGAGAAIAQAQPRSDAILAHDAPATLDVLAHVQNVGDLAASADGWAGRPGSGLAIEGFVILEDPFPPLAGLRYQVLNGDRSLSGTVAPGEYLGTRGENRPIFGLVVHAGAALSAHFELICEARFVDGSRSGQVPDGTLCASAKRGALESFRLSLRARSA